MYQPRSFISTQLLRKSKYTECAVEMEDRGEILARVSNARPRNVQVPAAARIDVYREISHADSICMDERWIRAGARRSLCKP